MSNRTSEASKAIRDAWEKEKILVQKGEGTRNWTPEQQKSIIDYGKAYDENGKAFEGHHMKSAEEYPEYQGDADNIQFLTREEHRAAHNGDFRNSTNGYYNPETQLTIDFGKEKYIPCEVIKLTEPIKPQNDIDKRIIQNSTKSGQDIRFKKFPKLSDTLVSTNNITVDFAGKERKSSKLKALIKKIAPKVLELAVEIVIDKISSKSSKKNEDNNKSIRNYPDGRKSPEEHWVSPYKNGTQVKGHYKGGKDTKK